MGTRLTGKVAIVTDSGCGHMISAARARPRAA
jgi:hypothetical protein